MTQLWTGTAIPLDPRFTSHHPRALVPVDVETVSQFRRQHGQMETIRKEKKVLGSCRCAGRYSRGWLGIGLVVIAASGLTGCKHLKTGAVSGGVVAATGLLTGGAVLPTAIAGGCDCTSGRRRSNGCDCLCDNCGSDSTGS